MRTHVKRLPVLAFALVACAVWLTGGPIPDRPEKLQFPPLSFNVPDASAMRVELNNGIPVYIIEDSQFPLVNVQLFFRGGQYLEPQGKEGLAELTGRVWRTGGAGNLSGQDLDEELDFLAARLSTSISGTNGSVSLNLLAKDLDRGMQLYMDVLLHPRFDEDRLAKAKDDLLAGMRKRNDDTSDIEGREWDRLLYGDDYWLNHLPTQASVDSIQRSDLVAFQGRLLNPKDIVVAVTGDFEKADMIRRLNATIGGISARAEPVPDVPQPTATPKPAVYLVNKPEVNQGRVSIGHMALKRPFDGEYALTVANDILGGGGFTSWIMSRVRSDEGLAYSAGSVYRINQTYPGTFKAFFQSKSASCARAAQITIDLMHKIQTQQVSDQELQTSKNSFVQTFPNRFQSPTQTASLYAVDELLGRSHQYWQDYRENINKVDAAAVQDAAEKYIHPDRLVILVVGNIDEILKGEADHPEAKFENFGELVRLPLRDPMTLKPITDDGK